MAGPIKMVNTLTVAITKNDQPFCDIQATITYHGLDKADLVEIEKRLLLGPVQSLVDASEAKATVTIARPAVEELE